MSWTDRSACRAINEIRDIYSVSTFIETGTYKGVNAKFQSNNFKEVISIEKDSELFRLCRKRLDTYPNILLINGDSAKVLKDIINDYKNNQREDYLIIYLDAHFYDPELPEGIGKFQILKELDSLIGFDKCIIIIHDFDNNLGHIRYDKIDLNMDLLKIKLLQINPNFKFYTNQLSSCDIITKKDVINGIDGLDPDMETLGNLDYAWSEPRLTYRGLLYCLPNNKVITGLREC